MSGYRTQSPDTSEAAERFLFAAYARMSPAEKGRIMFDLTRLGDEAALVEIRRRHPGCSEHEARMRLAARKYPRELLIAAFGWDPEAGGS